MPAPSVPWPEVGATDLLAVATGGALGTLLRAGGLLLTAPRPGYVPWVTMGENLLGAFLLGVAVIVLLRRAPGARRAHLFFATGVLGSFTTFSAFAVDLVRLADAESMAWAGLYLMASVLGGVFACLLGLFVGRRFSSLRPTPEGLER